MIAETEVEPYLVIVDDSEEDAELTTRVLKSGKLITSVVHFSDGAEALEYFFSASFKRLPVLMLLDLDMPKVGGLEVLRKIKQDELKKHIPIVIMSSCGDDNVIRESYSLGVNGFVRKHVQFEKFRQEMLCVGDFWLRTNYYPGNPNQTDQ
jgi:two-component system, response regulator